MAEGRGGVVKIRARQILAALEFLHLCANPKDDEAEYLSGSDPVPNPRACSRLLRREG